MDYTLLEEEELCGKCGAHYQYYSYGLYTRLSDEGQLSHEYPKTYLIISIIYTQIKGITNEFRRVSRATEL